MTDLQNPDELETLKLAPMGLDPGICRGPPLVVFPGNDGICKPRRVPALLLGYPAVKHSGQRCRGRPG